MSFLIVIGTRPEAIKMAPVIVGLKSRGWDVRVCSTGQHDEMLKEVLAFFSVGIDFDLQIMEPGQSLARLTGRLLTAIDNCFVGYAPEGIWVHGDTTSTLCGSLFGFFRGIPVFHVESGLRTFDMDAPFPEEFNRVVTALIASYHFAPTELAKENLLKEGVPEERVFVTGNTVIDAVQMASDLMGDDQRSLTITRLWSTESFDLSHKRFVMLTAHRRENFGQGIVNICRAISQLSQQNPDVYFVFPVHPNPSVRLEVQKQLNNISNVILTEPLGYPAFIYILKRCLFVVTDSGGIQEEATALKKNILILRSSSERPEAILSGMAKLVGSSADRIVVEVQRLLSNDLSRSEVAASANPFGDGRAVYRILEILDLSIRGR